MLHPHIRQQIASKCSSNWHSQYQHETTTARVWQKLTPLMVVDLLADVSSFVSISSEGPSTHFKAGQLLRDMQRSRTWLLKGAPHSGGKHGSTSKDKNLHITVKVGSTGYHLVCKETPRLHIIQITDEPH